MDHLVPMDIAIGGIVGRLNGDGSGFAFGEVKTIFKIDINLVKKTIKETSFKANSIGDKGPVIMEDISE